MEEYGEHCKRGCPANHVDPQRAGPVLRLVRADHAVRTAGWQSAARGELPAVESNIQVPEVARLAD